MRSKKSFLIAKIILLAVAAIASLRLYSRWDVASFGARRKLESDYDYRFPFELRGRHSSDSYYDQLWRGLKSKGIDHYSETSERIMRNRIRKQEKLLISEISQHRSTGSGHDMAWQLVRRNGVTPGTRQFERLVEMKGAKREENREHKTLSTLGTIVEERKRALEDATKQYQELVERLED